MRVWVAGELPLPVRAACGRWRDAVGVPGLRPVPDPSLHLTLVFLGERPESSVTSVAAALGEVRGVAGGLALGTGVVLPARRPRVLALGVVDPSGSLAGLQARAASACGVSERRRYRPHVTVGRLGVSACPDVLPAPEPLGFAISAIALMRTHLDRAGARHETLRRFSL